MQSESDTNDTSINKEDEGTSVTMVDVLKEQEAFEEDAKAVLGASDDKNCTYNSGYVKRQALYACITCCPDSVAEPSTRAGMCLACSLVCHENHDLVELYTKRNFRCDCGSSKFPNNPCNFTGIKSEPNIQNSYNQNFAGLYCVCHRPYPDPESNDEDEMIQCIICEDWLHSKHLNSKVPLSDQYSEMICQACMSSNDFLNNYMCYNVKAEERENESNMSAEVNDLDKSLSENKSHVDVMDQTDDCSLNKIDTSACLNANESITQIEQDKQEIDSKESPHIDSSSKSDINDSEIATTEECIKSDNITVDSASDASSPMNSIEKSSEVAVTNANESNDMEIQPTEINSLTAETSIEEIENKPVEIVSSDEIKIDSPLENENLPSDNPELLEITPQDEKIDTVNATEAEISPLENIDASIQKIDSKEDKESTDIVSEDNKDKCGIIENILPSITAESIDDPINESNEKSEILPEHVQPTEELSDSVKPVEPSAEIYLDESAITPEMSADNTTKDEPTVINELVPDNNSAVKESTNMDTNEDVSLMEDSTDVEKKMSPIIEAIESNLTENNLEPVPSIDNDTPAPEITGSLPIPSNECIKEDISPITDVSAVPPVPEDEIEPNVSENKEIAVEKDSDCKVDDASPTPDILTKLDATTMEVDSMENNSTNLEIESTQKALDAITENVEDAIGTQLDSTAMEVDLMENNSVKLGTESTQESSDAVTEKVEDANSKSIEKNILENNVLTIPQTLSNGETNGEENCTNTCESKKRKLDDETISDNEVVKKKKINNTDVVCIKPSDDQRVKHQGAVFWPSDWRRKLCPCSRCVVTYDENKVSFLLDTEDTVTAYEDLGKIKNSGSSQYEKGLEALSSLGHVQQINAITEYNKMKEKLNEFLTTFKNTNKVVKEEDIKSFFAGMKPKREPDGVYFCH